MEKFLIGAIIVLILFAFIPIQSTPSAATDLTQVTSTITNDAEEQQTLLISIVETEQFENSELANSEDREPDNEIIETNQETNNNDRNIFLSIGSLVLIGILLLLPL